MSRGTVCVVGSINMDLIVRAPHLPRPGETVLGGRFDTLPGGKGANQAVAAARMGAGVCMVGCVGADAHGSTLQGVLRSEDVDIRAVRRCETSPTGVALVTVQESSGENTIVVAPGANAAMAPADIDAAAEVVTAADIVLLQLELPVETVAHAALLARAAGARVVLNAAPARALPSELLEAVDVLIVNQTEAAQLAQDHDADTATLASRLAAGGGAVVLTLGAAGAVGHDERGAFAAPAPEVEVVDTVGAGDAFAGALAALLAEGTDLRAALGPACVAGARATTRHGAIPSLPRRDEL